MNPESAHKFLLFFWMSCILCLSATAESDFTRITSEGKLILDYKKKIAQFYDNVLVKNPQGTLKSDQLTVYFDASGNQIEKMIAIGHVAIDEKEHQAESHKAEFFSREGKLVLTGDPVIKKGPNYYSAEIITINTVTNKVFFEPSAKIVIKKSDVTNEKR